jgi:hypothetical protein
MRIAGPIFSAGRRLKEKIQQEQYVKISSRAAWATPPVCKLLLDQGDAWGYQLRAGVPPESLCQEQESF